MSEELAEECQGDECTDVSAEKACIAYNTAQQKQVHLLVMQEIISRTSRSPWEILQGCRQGDF